MVDQTSLGNDLTPQQIMRGEHEAAAEKPRYLPTGTQTVGPFFHYGLVARGDVLLLRGDTAPAGQRIRVTGTVYDGAGAPINDALLEIWQADSAGRFHTERAETGFDGFGRYASGEDGGFVLETIKPGAIDDPESRHGPHLNVHFFSRGLLHTLFTRIYFDDEDNAGDVMLEQVPESRRATLLARRQDDCDAVIHYRFDIHLQGAEETVFFEH